MANPTAEATKDQAQQVTETVAEETKSVASTAQQEAQHVAETAKEQLGTVADEVKSQASMMADQATSQVKAQAETQTQKAADMLRSYDAEVQALVEGRPEDAPNLVKRLQDGSSRINSLADGLEQRGVDGVIDDVRRFARRRPGLFLLGCATAGFAAARILRTTREPDPAPMGQLPPGGVAVPVVDIVEPMTTDPAVVGYPPAGFPAGDPLTGTAPQEATESALTDLLPEDPIQRDPTIAGPESPDRRL